MFSPIPYNTKKIIKEKGVKQKYVAEKAGIPEKTFSYMMNGRKKISAEEIQAISVALGVEPNDLFRDPNTKPESA